MSEQDCKDGGLEPQGEAAFRDIDEAIAWITQRMPKFGIQVGLKRMERLMELLGHPHRRLKFIHVAGTNGKGSTCAYLTRVLVQSGYDVGTFTSPYIERYQNRIQLNGVDIDDESLLKLANQIKPFADGMAQTDIGAPTMFEVSTAIAIAYFARIAFPDLVVWETGLGGRLDSTNIVAPIVSVITNVGHDHMDILGNSIEEIASEKAGIIKPGVPVVCTVEQPEAVEVMRRTAAERRTTLYLMGDQFRYASVESAVEHQVFDFSGPFRDVPGIGIALSGAHQQKNAALAVMTLEVLRQYYAVLVDDENLLEGMRTAAWAGRLEMIRREPPLLLDGAHNPEGAATLAEALRTVYPHKRLHLMMGMMPTKSHSDYLRHILPLVDTLIVTEPVFFKKMDADALADLAREVAGELALIIPIDVEKDYREALRMLTERTEPGDLAVVSGTLYLISDVRAWILYRKDSDKGW
ncbi:bifunctional folylpolyglutamate synthase/dihydrofolate synthase [Paenibacillus koleovorans]|uniref:bifunctional folylpolyglutamate synthase/dihydrofolate synthase n=1 Tax=Paenibacillus koleovorans TaxID=121608 RepID=UPI000FD6B98D|nr:folylpolyglutamate synthase/dihydrofolate synthase family protein [Paenibacillus koleovorans]